MVERDTDVVDNRPASLGGTLTQLPAHQEARSLIDLAERRSATGRNELYAAISDFFERRSLELTSDESELLVQILRQLSSEVAHDIRKQLAQRLANKPNAPRELVVMLANDDIEVCHDLLAHSSVLQNLDLIEIVRHRSYAHRMGVAIRQDLAEDVTAVLVATGEEHVVVTLLNNPSAKFSRATMEQLVVGSRGTEAYRSPLIQRKDLPLELAHEMLMWVSVALRSEILKRFDIDPEILSTELVEAASAVAAESEKQRNLTTVSPAERLVNKLHAADELTPAFVLKALRQGQVAIFELALAKLIRLSLLDVRRIVFDPAGEGLAVACRAIELDRAAFRALISLVRKAWSEEELATAKEIEELVRFYDSLTRRAATATLETWRRARLPNSRQVAQLEN